MTKRHEAKYKIDRRMGENVWGRPKSPVNKREYGPGQHGQRRKSKLSDYGVQLKAKQKLRGYYGNITERQFRGIYTEARRLKGDTGAHMIGLLERRLDAVVYRAKFVPTVFAARQFINHGHVSVNGRRVTIPSYRLKVDELVEVKEKSKQLALVHRGDRARRARRARLHRRQPPEDDREAVAHPADHRRALPGEDGTAPGGRVLFALTRLLRRCRSFPLVMRGLDPRIRRLRKSWILPHRDGLPRSSLGDDQEAAAYACVLSFTATPFSLSNCCSSFGLEHLADDVAAADELALDVELRDGRPVGIGLDAVAQVVGLQHVEALIGHAEVIEDLHDLGGEPAHREIAACPS